MKRNKLLILIFFACKAVFSQYDTLVRYELNNEKVSYVTPIASSDGLESAYTVSKAGSFTNFEYLPETPSAKTYNNSVFSWITQASDLFSLKDYPVSTSVKLAFYSNGKYYSQCSGVLVSSDLVLTAGHCMYGWLEEEEKVTWKGKLVALPAFDEGMVNSEFEKSEATEYFIFKSWYNYQGQWSDVALIKLKYPLGLKTGWIGLGYKSDTSFYIDNFFHVFSYPANSIWFDSTMIFNGDTLCYKYGSISEYQNVDKLVIDVPSASGESGGSIFYTDNSELAYSVGVLSYTGFSNSVFYRINQRNFPSLKYVVDNYSFRGEKYPGYRVDELNVWPNPFTDFLSVKSPQFAIIKSIEMLNGLGQSLRHFRSINVEKFELKVNSLEKGVYIIRVELDNGELLTKKILKM